MTTLTGRVVRPDDPGWPAARKNYNERFDVEPRAIVFCQNSQDVASAVRWARERDVPLRARCGRHSYEAYSLVEDGIIIDVSDMEHISVDGKAGTAQIGAGAYMLECSEKLGQVGVMLPLATGPTVGIAGLTLGGGFGFTSRKFGLTCDNLLNVELVTADGDIIQANAEENEDLFWACRGGGGGNFGIATSFTFKVHPVGLVVAFSMEWQWDQFEAVVKTWQSWAPETNRGITSALALNTEGTLQLYGIYTPDQPQDMEQTHTLLGPMLALGPTALTTHAMPYTMAARMFFVEGRERVDVERPQWAVHVHSDQQIYKATSAVARKPFHDEAIAELKHQLEQRPELAVPPSQASMVQLLGGGGAIRDMAPEDTAAYWRNIAFIVQYDAFWTAPADGERTMEWLEGFRKAMLPYTEGAYVNYVDADIDDPLRAYYGANLERLVEVKQTYDPDNVFNFPQSIPLEVRQTPPAG